MVQIVFSNLTPIEQAQELVTQIQKLQGEDKTLVSQCEQLLQKQPQNNSIVPEVIKLVVPNCKILLNSEEKDVEGAFNLLITLAHSSCGNEFPALLKSIIDVLLKQETEVPTFVTMKILSNTYNLLDSSNSSRYDILIALFTIASKTNKLSLLLQQLSQIQRWIDTPNTLSIENRRNLLLFISDSLKTKYLEESHKILVKYLQTFDNSSAAELDAAKTGAIQAIVNVIRIPSIMLMDDLLNLKAVKELKDSAMMELLHIYLDSGVREYITFYEKNKGHLEKNGLSHEQNLKKIRLVSLAALASKNILNEVPYSTIAETIQVPVEEVENWIIEAIQLGFIQAKMDQLNSVMVANRALNRKFEMEQWKELQEKLNSWRTSVADVLQVIDNAKYIVQNAADRKSVV